MSQSTAKGKVIGRFTIGFDDETKASISDLKTKLDAVPHRLNFGNVMPVGGLLAAMQDAAANDSNGVVRHGGYVKPELKHLGQWVFEGRDEKFQSAAVDGDGSAFLYQDKKSELKLRELKKHFVPSGLNYVQIDGVFDTTNWQDSAIDRETINDVEYLSDDLDECVPDIDDVLDQPNWLSESVPQITQADMQLTFIKNLATTLIQRMHSMNRFSEDDYAIGGNDLKAWDIVVDCDGLFGFAACDLIHHESNLLNRVRILRLRKFQDTTFTHGAIINGWRMDDINWHTITEDQLPAFRAALEASYA